MNPITKRGVAITQLHGEWTFAAADLYVAAVQPKCASNSTDKELNDPVPVTVCPLPACSSLI